MPSRHLDATAPPDKQATDPLPITATLAGCASPVAERASWPHRGSFADHAAQFPELYHEVA